MNKAGGIIAIIAGVFGVLSAGVTLLIGGIGSAAGSEGGATVIGLGWGGVFFSFLVIVFGAVGMNAASRWPGIFLLLSALAGIILGGTLVAVFMFLALVAGILVIAGSGKKQVRAP